MNGGAGRGLENASVGGSQGSRDRVREEFREFADKYVGLKGTQLNLGKRGITVRVLVSQEYKDGGGNSRKRLKSKKERMEIDSVMEGKLQGCDGN